jgi:hypothetical protein
MGAKVNTPEGEKLDVLVTLVEAYERKHYALLSRSSSLLEWLETAPVKNSERVDPSLSGIADRAPAL